MTKLLQKIAKRAGIYLKLYVNSTRCLSRHLLSKVGLSTVKNKVFAIGFNKTGTVSLHEVFIELGYHSNHGEYWRSTNSIWFHTLFDAFCDGIPDDFKILDKRYPNSKYILQVRNLDA